MSYEIRRKAHKIMVKMLVPGCDARTF